MKRIILRVVIIYLAFNLVLAALFISAGGLQMLASPELPEYQLPSSLSSDVSYLRELVLKNEADITPEQKEKFNRIIDSAENIATVDDLTLVASKALAVFDNAHTTVLAPKMYRLPVRFHWTSDALVIVKSRPEHSHLIGHRVLYLGDKSPEEMLSRMPGLVGGGTPNWRRYRSEYFYSAPSALKILGAAVDGQRVQISTIGPDGNKQVIMLKADAELMPGDPFWDFLDAFPDNTSFDTEGWTSLLHKDQRLPLYLQETEKLHLLRKIPEHKAIYVRMNASFSDKFDEIDDLERRALEAISQSQAKNIVVDFRHNRGGDYTKVLPLVKALSGVVENDGQIYLIVGPNTFSAGIIASSQFKRYTPDQLVVVGSEIGDKLRFKAEGFYPTLPHSKIQLYLTKGWTDLIDGCGWLDNCWPPNKVLLKKIGSLEIDIPVENTWESYRTGTDRVLGAVLNDIEHKHSK